MTSWPEDTACTNPLWLTCSFGASASCRFSLNAGVAIIWFTFSPVILKTATTAMILISNNAKIYFLYILTPHIHFHSPNNLWNLLCLTHTIYFIQYVRKIFLNLYFFLKSVILFLQKSQGRSCRWTRRAAFLRHKKKTAAFPTVLPSPIRINISALAAFLPSGRRMQHIKKRNGCFGLKSLPLSQITAITALFLLKNGWYSSILGITASTFPHLFMSARISFIIIIQEKLYWNLI